MDILTPTSIASRREALGLTREALAEEAGIDGSTLWRIEKGKMGGQIHTWRDLLKTLDRIEREKAA